MTKRREFNQNRDQSNRLLHQKLFRRCLVELVTQTERDGRERDVAIQIFAVNRHHSRVVQVSRPENRSVDARKDDEHHYDAAPECAGKEENPSEP
jgi:hypothetical protein